MHLFDIRSILMAKHAQHIVVIHFPIALFIMSVLFDLLAGPLKSPALKVVAFYNLAGAAVSSVIAAVTGLLAWQLLYDGGRPAGILLFHLIGASISLVLLWILVALRYRHRIDANWRITPTYRIMAFGAVIAILATAHLGGILSGVVQLIE